MIQQVEFHGIGTDTGDRVLAELDVVQAVELIKNARAQNATLYLCNDPSWSQSIAVEVMVVESGHKNVHENAYRTGERLAKQYAEILAHPDGRLVIFTAYLPYTVALQTSQYHNLRVLTGASNDEVPDVDHNTWRC